MIKSYPTFWLVRAKGLSHLLPTKGKYVTSIIAMCQRVIPPAPYKGKICYLDHCYVSKGYPTCSLQRENMLSRSLLCVKGLSHLLPTKGEYVSSIIAMCQRVIPPAPYKGKICYLHHCYVSKGYPTCSLQRVNRLSRSLLCVKGFISPPNVYISNTWLVPGITGGCNARWCQRAL